MEKDLNDIPKLQELNLAIDFLGDFLSNVEVEKASSSDNKNGQSRQTNNTWHVIYTMGTVIRIQSNAEIKEIINIANDILRSNSFQNSVSPSVVPMSDIIYANEDQCLLLWGCFWPSKDIIYNINITLESLAADDARESYLADQKHQVISSIISPDLRCFDFC